MEGEWNGKLKLNDRAMSTRSLCGSAEDFSGRAASKAKIGFGHRLLTSERPFSVVPGDADQQKMEEKYSQPRQHGSRSS